MTEELLDARYGRDRQRGIDRRLGWVLAGILAIGGLAVVLFGGWHLTSDLEFKDLSYSVVDDRTVKVDVQVTGPADADIACVVEALSASYAQVGWKVVELPAGQDRTRRFETSIITTSQAATGTVRECWVRSA